MKTKTELKYKGKPYIVDVNSIQLQFAHGILKRLYRRMQMKGVRMLQVAKKKRGSSVLLYRAYTWEEASRLLEIEMDNLKCQIKKISRT